jgi:hypothetical protein
MRRNNMKNPRMKENNFENQAQKVVKAVRVKEGVT